MSMLARSRCLGNSAQVPREKSAFSTLQQARFMVSVIIDPGVSFKRWPMTHGHTMHDIRWEAILS